MGFDLKRQNAIGLIRQATKDRGPEPTIESLEEELRALEDCIAKKQRIHNLKVAILDAKKHLTWFNT